MGLSSTWRWSEGSPLDAVGRRALQAEARSGCRYVLLLSHMRSYSSLLAHLLGQSPHIEGYGETHVRYRNRLGPWLLERAVRRSVGRPLRGEWLLDKVLHNNVRPIERWVGEERVRALIFLRRPGPALRSALVQARRHPARDALRDADACCDYYVTRLHRLREDGERLRRRALYFDAETLVERPQALLDAIGEWLGLGARLATDYRPGSRTGEMRFGDLSPNIRAGRVLGTEHSTVHHAEAIPEPLLAEAEAAYRRCRSSLLVHCALTQAGLLG